jgi:hypothetical protein
MRAATASVAVSPVAPARIPLPLAILAFCLLWSSAFAAAKLAIADCPPLILLALRFLAAGALMLGAAAIAGVSWSLSRRDVAVFALLGVANQAVYLGLAACSSASPASPSSFRTACREAPTISPASSSPSRR